MSLLCEAAASGSISRCRQLLEAGNDVEEKDEDGWTPLLNAAYFGHTKVCELLLEEGKANIEETEPTPIDEPVEVYRGRGVDGEDFWR